MRWLTQAMHWLGKAPQAVRQTVTAQRTQAAVRRRAITDALWHSTVQALPFVQQHLRPADAARDLERLRTLCSLFLDHKEFSGARGWQVSDEHAVMVAAQACLVLLHIAPPAHPAQAMQWYDSFVGIVLHAGQVRARRSEVDQAGVMHHWQESLTGEVQYGGPLMLAYSDVAAAGELAKEAYNVVIHEFVHVIDMRKNAARGHWHTALQTAFAQHCDHVAQWERFGTLATHAPLLDSYAAKSVEEFFAVAAEAYFVRRDDFSVHHPDLLVLFDGFFRAHYGGH
jgi:MtfA peptidase